ncbi:MAG: twin-arginine translocase TatA/TatE family subunit [Pseudobdellovibrionaceae bacterium]
MLDFSWSEFLVVLVVAVVAIGPKQLPELLFGLGRMVRRLQYMKFALSKQFDTFMEEADLHELRKLNDISPRTVILDEIEDDMAQMKATVTKDDIAPVKKDDES